MAIRLSTIKLSNGLSVTVDDTVGLVVRRLVLAWARSWQVVAAQWSAVAAELAAQDGKPTPRTIRRAQNVQRALEGTRQQLQFLSRLPGVDLQDVARVLAAETAKANAAMIASQLPKGSVDAQRILRQAELPNRQLDAIVRRTTQRIESQARPLAALSTEDMLDALVRAAATGSNPRVAAAEMVKAARGQFDGGLTRALVISRTELLDAHREAARAAQSAQSDVLDGWAWNAHLSSRTCPGCWSKHGTKHPLSEAGPDGHQQCRCSRMPVTKSWSELGYDIAEPPSLLRDGETEFRRLPKAQQLDIMGPTRLRGLDSGVVLWDDLATRKRNPGWRDSITTTPVRDLRGIERTG